MATLNQILAEQVKLIGEAKKNLEEAQKKPPRSGGPIAGKEATVAELKARVTGLTAAKADAVRQIDEQIAAYQKEIAVLEKQIEEDKKQQGDQPPTPRPRGRGRKN
jgi:chromosome segregation ATPase